jgi:hypothetical protein
MFTGGGLFTRQAGVVGAATGRDARVAGELSIINSLHGLTDLNVSKRSEYRDQ